METTRIGAALRWGGAGGVTMVFPGGVKRFHHCSIAKDVHWDRGGAGRGVCVQKCRSHHWVLRAVDPDPCSGKAGGRLGSLAETAEGPRALPTLLSGPASWSQIGFKF